MELEASRTRHFAPYDASDLQDDDILDKQIQADLQFQAGSQETSPRLRLSKSKRKSHDLNGGDETMRKKRRKKTLKPKKLVDGMYEVPIVGELSLKPKKHASESQHEIPESSEEFVANTERREDFPHDRSPITASPRSYVDNVVKPALDNQPTSDSRPIVTTPFGSRNEALMRTVLSGCTRVKFDDYKQKQQESQLEQTPNPSRLAKAESVPTKTKRERKVREPKPAATHRKWSLVPILPKDYQLGPREERFRHPCPVDTCDCTFTRSTGLGQHMHRVHSGGIMHDNGDGTFSVITAEEEAERLRQESLAAASNIPEPFQMALPSLNGHSHSKSTAVEPTNGDRTPILTNGDKTLMVSKKSTISKSGSCFVKKKGKAAQRTPTPPPVKPEISDVYSTDTDSEEEEPPATARRRLSSSMSSAKGTTSWPSQPERSTIPSPRKANGVLSSPIRPESVMEEWEMSDGRIPETKQFSIDAPEEGNHVAFSTKYIQNHHSIWVSDGVNFTIQRLGGGETHLWSDDKHYLRICSVAAGKVLVRMGDSDFTIGAHGMWKIPAGERCSATNRNYAEAVIHVSAILEE